MPHPKEEWCLKTQTINLCLDMYSTIDSKQSVVIFHIQPCTAQFTARQMKNGTRNASLIIPVTPEDPLIKL